MKTLLADFTKAIDNIKILTDATERQQGMSHGCFSLQDGLQEKKSFFFSHLSPQPNGAGFVSMQISKPLNLSSHSFLQLHIQNLCDRGTYYQLTLKDQQAIQNQFSFIFSFSLKPFELATITAPLNRFFPVKRGKPHSATQPLNLGNVHCHGIRIVGRPKGEEIRQSGLYGCAMTQLSAR